LAGSFSPSASLDGLLLIDKPAGITSHDVVDEIRRRFSLQRVGHAGTLDPAATGLLLILVGPATRGAGLFLGYDKSYRATLRLGCATDTLDQQGRVLERKEIPPLTHHQVEEVCRQFQGQIQQEIPAYSALRRMGRRSYEWARRGVKLPPKIREVTIKTLEVLDLHLPDVELEIACSKGTYIRALCADIGNALGCGGHLAQLRRIRVGPYSTDQAISLKEAAPHHLIPLGVATVRGDDSGTVPRVEK